MKKKIIIILAIFLAIAFCFYLTKNKKSQNKELTLYGNIEIRQVDLSFLVGGRILKMEKEEGDFIKKGEFVAEIDNKDYVSNLEKAEADVEKTLALKNDALAKYDRQSPLCFDNTVSKQDCDTLFYNKNKTGADYNLALAQRTYAQNQLNYTKIYAPDDGIVTIRVQEPGAVVSAGQSVYTISKTKPVWIRAYISEKDLANVKYGMKAKVLLDTINPETSKNRVYNAYVGYISPVAEFTPKTVESTDLRANLVYRIRVYIDEIDEYLRQGMPATVKIDLLPEK